MSKHGRARLPTLPNPSHPRLTNSIAMYTATLVYTTPIYGGVERVKLTKRGDKFLVKAFINYQRSVLPSDATIVYDCIVKSN